MRTLKISVIATIAALVAWQLHIPQRIWPSHPVLGDVLATLIITLVIQFTWDNAKKSS